MSARVPFASMLVKNSDTGGNNEIIMIKRILIFIAVSITIFAFLLAGAKFIGGGTDLYAEIYEFSVREQTLINAVKRYKEQHPWTNDQIDGRQSLDPVYMIFVNLPETNITYISYLAPQFSGHTQLKLISIYYNHDSTHIKRVNTDLNGRECDVIKKNFELKFLDSLGISYKKKGNPMKIGPIQL